MEIITQINDTLFDSTEYKTSNTYPNYHFVNMTIVASINYNDKVANLTLQTGSSFDYNDYSMPSNSLGIYESDDDFIKFLENEGEPQNQLAADYINEECGTSYSLNELYNMYTAVRDLIHEAQQLVNAKENKAGEELETDSYVYVMYTERENMQVDGDVYEYQQCAETCSMRFNDSDAANEFIKEKANDIAYLIEKEEGVSYQNEGSNF